MQRTTSRYSVLPGNSTPRRPSTKGHQREKAEARSSTKGHWCGTAELRPSTVKHPCPLIFDNRSQRAINVHLRPCYSGSSSIERHCCSPSICDNAKRRIASASFIHSLAGQCQRSPTRQVSAGWDGQRYLRILRLPQVAWRFSLPPRKRKIRDQHK